MELRYKTRAALLVLALLCNPGLGNSHDHASKPPKSMDISPSVSTEVCESRTINYITHTLPQQCLRTSWTSQPPAVATATGDGTSATPTVASGGPGDARNATEPVAEQKEENQAGEKTSDQQPQADKEAKEEQEELATTSFMSFEEWKEMMLRKSGQDPADIKAHNKPHREHKVQRDGQDSHADLDSLGDDGEISIDFGALSDKVSELTAAKSGGSAPEPSVEPREEQVLLDDGKMQYYRSKDAGKTCKERFSYSSFDAGATVLKTSPGAKNAKSILVENKDSYMLLECHTKNKFVIVELSDDILVDTVVLANFEFFSSMIREFRVSVSDRYPVKLDKWVELGTFEARNSRDIQAFLIEHPQIYTKYIRIEFLTHYGNEYYCPVSLLRVHGTRMLDSWKEPDNSRDDDESDATIEGSPEEQAPESSGQEPEPTQEPSQPSNATEQISVPKPEPAAPRSDVNLTLWQPVFYHSLSLDTCAIEPSTTDVPTPVAASPVAVNGSSSASEAALQTPTGVSSSPASGPTSVSHSAESIPSSPSSSSSRPPNPSPPPIPSTDSAASNTPVASPSQNQQQQPSPRTNVTESPPPSPPPIKASSSAASPKNKTSTSTASSASPTVQESFFKTVTKRLQHLETNTSLSLQYIEEQSRFLQEALRTMEKRQLARVDAFLDALNKTVFAELRVLRGQYDQVWQSTVIALESQRDQAQRETVALSARLALLADEVVFQKRMAILQSVLLLAALVLVIFSRGYYVNASASQPPLPPPGPFYHPGSGLSPFRPAADAAAFSPRSPQSDDPDSADYSAGSPSPGFVRSGSLRQALSRSGSYRDKDLPLTPVSRSAASSVYGREPTPTISVGEAHLPFFHDEEDEEAADGRAGAEYVTPPNRRRDGSSPFSDDLGGGTDSAEGTPVGPGAEGRTRPRNGGDGYVSGPDILAQAQEQQQQQAQNSRWSAASQLGVVRKPLPALPEDVPEDPGLG